MKKIFFVCCFALAAMSAAAQKKFYVSPAVGGLRLNSEAEREFFYSELTVGYKIFRNIQLDAAGGYGSCKGRSVYTSAVLVSPLSGDLGNVYFNSSIGVGLQKRSWEKDVKFTAPFVVHAGFNFTPWCGGGLFLKTFLSSKSHSMMFAGASVFFRL